MAAGKNYSVWTEAIPGHLLSFLCHRVRQSSSLMSSKFLGSLDLSIASWNLRSSFHDATDWSVSLVMNKLNQGSLVSKGSPFQQTTSSWRITVVLLICPVLFVGHWGQRLGLSASPESRQCTAPNSRVQQWTLHEFWGNSQSNCSFHLD